MADEISPARADDMGVLLEVLAVTRDGSGCPVVISGEAEAGKTALAEQLSRQVSEDGVVVLWASCESTPDAPGFWPWLQLLRQYMRRHATDDFPQDLRERMAEVVEMAPGVDHVIGGGAVPESLEIETARFRLFDAVAQVLHRAAEEDPLLVVLDDVQAADEPSLALLRHVGGDLSGSRVMLLVLCRPAGPRASDDLRETLAVLARARGARRLDLPPPPGSRVRRQQGGGLSPREGEVAALVADGLSNREIGDRLFVSERTAENHVQNILNKLGFNTRAQVAAWVARNER